MAVTSTQGTLLTFIEENGSDPTGTGGAIINNNFKLLDNYFSTACGSGPYVAYATSAGYAERASYIDGCIGYADYANCAGFACTASSADIAQLAIRPGFANPEGNYYYSDYCCGSYPIAVWGSSNSNSASSGSLNCNSFGSVPSFGPIMMKVMLCAFDSNTKNTRIFAECLVFGWDGNITEARVIRAYDTSGDDITSNVHTVVGNTYSEGNSIYFRLLGGKLQSACTIDTSTSMTMHMTCLSLYPNMTGGC